MAKVTLRDVAEAAGVSIATASWAVNDNRDVQITESTRRKVRRAADELGYHHNALARGLAEAAPTSSASSATEWPHRPSPAR